MPNIIRESIRLQHIESPFTYSCRRGEHVERRSLSGREKCGIVAITIFASPFVGFVLVIPLFFLFCAWANGRKQGFVYIPRARPIRVPVGEGLGVNARVPRNGRAGRNVFLRTFLGRDARHTSPNGINHRPAHAGHSSVRDERRVPAGARHERQDRTSAASRPAREAARGTPGVRQSRDTRTIPEAVGNRRQGVAARRV